MYQPNFQTVLENNLVFGGVLTPKSSYVHVLYIHMYSIYLNSIHTSNSTCCSQIVYAPSIGRKLLVLLEMHEVLQITCIYVRTSTCMYVYDWKSPKCVTAGYSGYLPYNSLKMANKVSSGTHFRVHIRIRSHCM